MIPSETPPSDQTPPSAPPPDALLEEADRLLKAATPGPWQYERAWDAFRTVADCGHLYCVNVPRNDAGFVRREDAANAALIAAAPTLIARLAGALRDCRAELDETRKMAEAAEFQRARLAVTFLGDSTANLDADRGTLFVEVARDLLPSLREWSEPVEVQADGQRGRILSLVIRRSEKHAAAISDRQALREKIDGLERISFRLNGQTIAPDVDLVERKAVLALFVAMRADAT